MDHSRTMSGGGVTGGGALLACFVAIGLVASAQSPSTSEALDALIARAAATSSGTYQLQGASIGAAAAALPVLVHADVLRAPDRTIRVPLMIGTSVPRAATVRLRIVRPGSQDPPNVIAEETGSVEAGAVRFLREFPLAAGSYEVHAAVAYPMAGGAVNAALTKVPLTVPDAWGGPLAITPVVLGETVGLAPATGSRPFTFGPSALTPAIAAAFAQRGMLHVAWRAYNWRAEAGSAPDLTAEYVFHEDDEARPIFFNKVKAQRLTAQTLGKAFDPASGAVAAGLSVSLAPFQVGDYTLTVRVRDNRARPSAEQRVRFSVRR